MGGNVLLLCCRSGLNHHRMIAPVLIRQPWAHPLETPTFKRKPTFVPLTNTTTELMGS